jgi:hypothetical protein
VPQGLESYNDKCVRVIPSYYSLNKRLKHEDKKRTLFVSIQTYNWDVLRLFWVMSKNGCKLSVFGKNMIPTPALPIASKMQQYNISQIIRGFLNRIAYVLKKWGVIKSYEVLFLSAETGIESYGYSTQKEINLSRHILINGDDYDRALSIIGGKRIIDEDYIVFLDECLPLHPDIGICNITPMDADVYYRELNAFFDKIELEMGKIVIIAAHPKSLVYKEKDYFGGRNVIFGKTAELVRDSSLVLFHDSTSIGYGVCFNKPIVSLVSRALRDGQRETFESILCFSKELNTCLVYIDEYCKDKHMELWDDLIIDKNAYTRYKYRYLTNPETENAYSSNFVIEGLKSL